MRLRKIGLTLGLALTVSLLAAPAKAVVLAEFDFEQPVDGNMVPNQGSGPDGILFENATVADGVLQLTNIDLSDVGDPHGMDIPFGVLNPFGGGADFSVQFDFMTEDGGSGPLFSSDSSAPGNEDVQFGSLNIYLGSGGVLVADSWFVGALNAGGGFNDGEFHTVRLDYIDDSENEVGIWEFYVDDLEEPVAVGEGEDWWLNRDATTDRTRAGGLSNTDFGFEIDAEMDALEVSIDNLIIEAPSPPPVLVTVDRESGEISAESILGDDLSFSSLGISSSSGSLNPEAWASISGSLDGAGDGSVSGSNWNMTRRHRRS